MRWLLSLLAVFAIPFAASAQGKKNPHIADTDPLPPAEQIKRMKLPPGFVIQLVASEPKVKKPINIAFDAQGRLYVTESIEYPYAAPPGKGRDTVKILEDFGPDGLARKVSTFADGLNIPIGVLPLPTKGALVYSIPSLFHIVPGAKETRTPLFGQYGFKDTHGMTGEFMHGLDGWVYCCHGFSNTSTVKSQGDSAITMQSGNTYRIKPDGSKIEYYTHGQVNPFGLAFDPWGHLYSADCHTRPVYQLLKGAYYPSFGKPHDGLGFGPEMVTHSHGSTAIAGIAYYAATQFPKEYRDNVFVGNVVTNRINRDRVEWTGATPKGIELPDLVISDDPWFRPVDIKLGPDGALYVADFYNRIIGHYEVPLDHPARDRERGRIWRIVYQGEGGQALAPIQDLTKLDAKALISRLDDDNFWVRTQATHQLAAMGESAVKPLQAVMLGSGVPRQMVHALWALERLGGLNDACQAALMRQDDAFVRVHFLRVLSERAKLDATQRAFVIRNLGHSHPQIQRAAAETLGSHPNAEFVFVLAQQRLKTSPQDTHLTHVVRMALRNQLRAGEVWAKLQPDQWKQAEAQTVADVCPGVHNEASAAFLVGYLSRYAETPGNWTRFVQYAARFGPADASSRILAAVRKHNAADVALQGQVLKALQQGLQEAGKPFGADLRDAAQTLVKSLLVGNDERNLAVGIELAGSLKLTGAEEALLALATSANTKDTSRKAAIAGLFQIEPKKYVDTFNRMLTDDKAAVETREQIANNLAAANVPLAFDGLVLALQNAPARLQTTIALALASSPQGGDRLLQAVEQGKASGRLLQEDGVKVRLGLTKLPKLQERIAHLTKSLPAFDQRVQALVHERRQKFLAGKSDAALGKAIFDKHCAACHQIANQGSKIGPQLDGIGIRGVDRLLEDILDPNRNVDQAFRATTLVLNNGRLVTGLVLRQEGEVIVLADNQGKETRVGAKEVQERFVSPLSPMPANFAEQIGEGEFYSLLAYLLEQRVSKK